MTTTNPSIGLLGQYGARNLGNEGSLAAFAALAPEGASLCVIGEDPEEVTRQHAMEAVCMDAPPSKLYGRLPTPARKAVSKLRDVPYTFRLARRFDAVVVPGSGILEQLGVGPWGVPLQLFRFALVVRLLRRQFVLFGVGAEPNEVGTNRWLMKNTVRLANYVSFRDEYSRQCMVEMGAAVADAPIHPDVAFSADLKVPETPIEQHVAVGVMAYYGLADDPRGGGEIHCEYVDKMVSFVRWLAESGRTVELVVGAETDLKVARAIESDVRRSCSAEVGGRVSTVATQDLQALAQVMGRSSTVVATRFHNILVALKVARPTISIGYGPKNAVLMETVGLGKFCQDIETLDVDMLMEQHQRLEGEATSIRSHLEQAVEGKGRDVERQTEDMWVEVGIGSTAPGPKQASAHD